MVCQYMYSELVLLYHQFQIDILAVRRTGYGVIPVVVAVVGGGRLFLYLLEGGGHTVF